VDHPDVRESTLDAIGNTPVVRLRRVVPEGSADVLVKLEYVNPTGSYKDRMALAMIEGAERRGDLRPGMTVLEYTGGSTGTSLAFVCAVKGYRLQIISSDAFAQEKLATMRAFGADLEIIPSEGGKTTPDLIPRMMARAAELAATGDYYRTDQFNNRDSLEGYAKIGDELLRQTASIDVFCGSVGTAGMLMGVAGRLRAANPDVRVVALEPASSTVLAGGKAGTHGVEGIAAGFVPPMFDSGIAPETRAVDEGEARAMARRLAREEGIFAGTSSALNVVGALEIASELGPGKTVVTVAVDTGLKYLAGNLFATSGETD
jgi:cysteine synthase